MTGCPKFKVKIVGCFYTTELYDQKGAEVFDLESAAEAAEAEYGEDWDYVYNGRDAISREEWV